MRTFQLTARVIQSLTTAFFIFFLTPGTYTMRNYYDFLFLIAIFAVALLQFPTQGQTVVRIGRTISTEGFNQLDSEIITEGFDFWVEDVKKRGGIRMHNYDGQVHDIEVITREDASNNEIVDLQYRELIETNGSHLLFAPFGGSLVGTATRRANLTQTPIVSAAGLSSGQHFFSIQAPYANRAKICIELFNRTADIKNMVALSISGDIIFQNLAIKGFTEEAEKIGIQRTYNLTFNASDTASVLERFKTNHTDQADILFLAGAPMDVVAFLPKLRDVYDPRLVFVANGATLATIAELLTWEAEYVVDATQWVASLNLTDEYYITSLNFEKEFTLRQNKTPQIFHTAGYISGYIMEKALQVSRSLDSSDLIYAIKNLNLTSLWGHISFGPQGYLLSTPVCRQIVKNKQINIIAPDLLMTKALVYPGIPSRPPPPRFSQNDYLMMKIWIPICGGMVLLCALAVVAYYLHMKYHFITIPKQDDSEPEWGS